MKSILLTAVVLFLSAQLRFDNGFNTDNSFYVNVTASELSNDNTFKKADSVTSNKEIKKAPVNNSKKEKAKKNKRSKWLTKQSAANQNNLQLHKKVSQAGMHTEKGAVTFDFDQHTLKSTEAFHQVMHLADQLLFDSTRQVSIAGYTDNIGDGSYNDILSYKRAQNIKDYLVELGVSENQIHLSFNGMADPVSDNDQESGRAENRRVEFVLFSAG